MLETSSPSSPAPKLTKKQQKAASFKASKKGKGASQVPDGGDLPQMDDDVDVESPSAPVDVKKSKKAKVDKKVTELQPSAAVDGSEVKEDGKKADKKKSKKRKLDESVDEAATDGQVRAEDAAQTAGKDKATKTKKAKSSAAPTSASTASAVASTSKAGAKKTTFGDDGQVASEEVTETVAPSSTSAPNGSGGGATKLILFVGNMSFDQTASDIADHFGGTCGEKPTVRLLTKKADPSALAALSKSKQKSIAKGKAKHPSAPQSKGCAFLEFQSNAAVQKALKFHHTMFGGRQINVELTAGGGGKSAARKDKIAKKNQALEKERQKIHETYVAPANASHKAKQAEAAANGGGPAQPPRKKARSDGEGEAQWGRRAPGGGAAQRGGRGGKSGRGGAMPRFGATGANAMALTSTR